MSKHYSKGAIWLTEWWQRWR